MEFLLFSHSSVIQSREVLIVCSESGWGCSREQISRHRSCFHEVYSLIEKPSYNKVGCVTTCECYYFYSSSSLFMVLLCVTWNEESTGLEHWESCFVQVQVVFSCMSLDKSLYPFHVSFYFQTRSD